MIDAKDHDPAADNSVGDDVRHPLDDKLACIVDPAKLVVSAAYNRATGGRNEPAKYEWPALLRKLDRIDPSYKQ
jgi:hypothetical protein